MAPKDSSRHTRRALLTAAAGAAAATAAQAIARPLSVTAAGQDGTALVIGGLYADARSQTTLANMANNEIVLWVASNADQGNGAGIAVSGSSAKGIGVQGLSPTGTAVRAASETGFGIVATAPNGTAVRAVSQNRTGVHGVSGIGTGVAGDSGTGFGVVGASDDGTGVRGLGSRAGSVGVHAISLSSGGTALRVEGKASFDRSGRTLIAANRSSLVVDLAGVTPTSKIFAVLATNRSGRWVRAVVAGTDKFTVYLNIAVASQSTISWFVLD